MSIIPFIFLTMYFLSFLSYLSFNILVKKSNPFLVSPGIGPGYTHLPQSKNSNV
jgi:hypothetical protein